MFNHSSFAFFANESFIFRNSSCMQVCERVTYVQWEKGWVYINCTVCLHSMKCPIYIRIVRLCDIYGKKNLVPVPAPPLPLTWVLFLVVCIYLHDLIFSAQNKRNIIECPAPSRAQLEVPR